MKIVMVLASLLVLSSVAQANSARNEHPGDNYGMPAGGVIPAPYWGWGEGQRAIDERFGDNYGMPVGGEGPYFHNVGGGRHECEHGHGDNYGNPGNCR